MKKTLPIVFIFTLLAAFGAVRAQDRQKADPERDILAAVQKLFDAMATRDIVLAELVMVPEGRFFSFRVVDGKETMRSVSNRDFIDGLKTGTAVWRERMWNPKVSIHGPIANVWTPYDFWIDGKLSHCGIDSFDLIKVDGQWKLAGGSYTVETECKPSPLGPLKR